MTSCSRSSDSVNLGSEPAWGGWSIVAIVFSLSVIWVLRLFEYEKQKTAVLRRKRRLHKCRMEIAASAKTWGIILKDPHVRLGARICSWYSMTIIRWGNNRRKSTGGEWA